MSSVMMAAICRSDAMTKLEQIAAHLRERGSITPKEAYFEYRSMRLSDIIFKLRNRGWSIRTEMVTVTQENGSVETFARYGLESVNGC